MGSAIANTRSTISPAIEASFVNATLKKKAGKKARFFSRAYILINLYHSLSRNASKILRPGQRDENPNLEARDSK
jgi:hypothetical protein